MTDGIKGSELPVSAKPSKEFNMLVWKDGTSFQTTLDQLPILAEAEADAQRATDAAEAAELSQTSAANDATSAAQSETNAATSASEADADADRSETASAASITAAGERGFFYHAGALPDPATGGDGGGPLANGVHIADNGGKVWEYLIHNGAIIDDGERNPTPQQIVESTGLRAAYDGAVPVNSLPEQCVLIKRRDAFVEYDVYIPADKEGVNWSRRKFTNRLNPNNDGMIREVNVTRALLYKSTVVAPFAANANGVQAGAAPAAVGTAAADSRTGTWTASASVGGVTDIRYSEVVGDSVTYTVTGERLSLRTYANSSLAGVFDVLIKNSSDVEISASNYRNKKLYLDQLDGRAIIPLADNLASGDYTITLTVAPENGTLRAYEGGVLGYDAVDIDTDGRYGLFNTRDGYATCYYPGEKTVQSFNGTAVNIVYAAGVPSGIIRCTIFDVSDSVVASADVDMHASSVLTERTTSVASGLPLGDYRLQTEVLETATGTATRHYDGGLQAFNESLAGEVGVDAFDNLGNTDDAPNNISNFADNTLLAGTGNLEFATKIRQVGDSDGEEFVGGTHQNDRVTVAPVFNVDGTDFDFDDLTIGVPVLFKNLLITHQSIVSFPTAPNGDWATNDYRQTFSSYGYRCDVDSTTTADARVFNNYFLMFMPMRAVSTALAPAVGLHTIVVDSGGSQNDELTDGSRVDYLPANGAVAYGNGWALSAFNASFQSALRENVQFDSTVRAKTQVFSRSEGSFKYYNQPHGFDDDDGVIVPSGTRFKHTNFYRAVLLDAENLF